MKRLALRAGFTMLETMVGAGIFSLIFLGGYTIMHTASVSFDRNTRQTSADAGAATALNWINSDLREAQSFTTAASTLNITYPPIAANGWYDRYNLNMNGPDITYYLANAQPDGTWTLKRRDWRITTDQNGDSVVDAKDHTQTLCRDVSLFNPVPANGNLPNALLITIRTKETKDRSRAETAQEIANGTAKTTELKQRVAFARNYCPDVNNP